MGRVLCSKYPTEPIAFHMSPNEIVLPALRAATHAAHVRINRHPFIAGLTKPGFPMERYRQLLAAYFDIYGLIEDAIERCERTHAVNFAYGPRKKRPWLEADLRQLHIDTVGAPQGAHGAGLAPLEDVGGLVGTLYVIEGATLGGQVISRHLRSTLGLDADNGARFFNGYGDSATTQLQWLAFCQFAESIAGSPQWMQSAQSAAIAVFELIEKRLDDLHARTDH